MYRHPDIFRKIGRTLLEMIFIIFLFYSNLLMGQYIRGRGFAERPLQEAVGNIFTLDNFIIAVAAAFIGHVAFDYLRKRL
jgi:hypothetical protein